VQNTVEVFCYSINQRSHAWFLVLLGHVIISEFHIIGIYSLFGMWGHLVNGGRGFALCCGGYFCMGKHSNVQRKDMKDSGSSDTVYSSGQSVEITGKWKEMAVISGMWRGVRENWNEAGSSGW